MYIRTYSIYLSLISFLGFLHIGVGIAVGGSSGSSGSMMRRYAMKWGNGGVVSHVHLIGGHLTGNVDCRTSSLGASGSCIGGLLPHLARVKDKSNLLELDGAGGGHPRRLIGSEELVILPLAMDPLTQPRCALWNDAVTVNFLVLQQLFESLVPGLLQMLRRQVQSLSDLEYKSQLGQVGDALPHGIGGDLHVGLAVGELPALAAHFGRELSQLGMLRRHLEMAVLGLELAELLQPLLPSEELFSSLKGEANVVELDHVVGRQLGAIPLALLELAIFLLLVVDPRREFAILGFFGGDQTVSMGLLVRAQLDIHFIPPRRVLEAAVGIAYVDAEGLEAVDLGLEVGRQRCALLLGLGETLVELGSLVDQPLAQVVVGLVGCSDLGRTAVGGMVVHEAIVQQIPLLGRFACLLAGDRRLLLLFPPLGLGRTFGRKLLEDLIVVVVVLFVFFVILIVLVTTGIGTLALVSSGSCCLCWRCSVGDKIRGRLLHGSKLLIFGAIAIRPGHVRFGVGPAEEDGVLDTTTSSTIPTSAADGNVPKRTVVVRW